MIEINRIYTTQPGVMNNTRASVTPTQSTAAAPEPVINQERRKQHDRRKHNKKPVIERRVSSDRRSPMFDAEA